MRQYDEISDVKAREVSIRGNPTVEVDVALSDGTVGRALVPSGASTGANEALELRDGEPLALEGAVCSSPSRISTSTSSLPSWECPRWTRKRWTNLLIEIDGTPNKSKLGANAILACLWQRHAPQRRARVRPLYERISGDGALTLPVPMLMYINGGAHAAGSTDFQEFMVVPAGFDTFREALRAGVEIYHALADALRERGLSTSVGDEGGFAPALPDNQDAVALVIEAIERAKYRTWRAVPHCAGRGGVRIEW